MNIKFYCIPLSIIQCILDRHGLIHWFSIFSQLLESLFVEHFPLRNTAGAQYDFQHRSKGNREEAYQIRRQEIEKKKISEDQGLTPTRGLSSWYACLHEKISD